MLSDGGNNSAMSQAAWVSLQYVLTLRLRVLRAYAVRPVGNTQNFVRLIKSIRIYQNILNIYHDPNVQFFIFIKDIFHVQSYVVAIP